MRIHSIRSRSCAFDGEGSSSEYFSVSPSFSSATLHHSIPKNDKTKTKLIKKIKKE